jgi:hypothetical protein
MLYATYAFLNISTEFLWNFCDFLRKIELTIELVVRDDAAVPPSKSGR